MKCLFTSLSRSVSRPHAHGTMSSIWYQHRVYLSKMLLWKLLSFSVVYRWLSKYNCSNFFLYFSTNVKRQFTMDSNSWWQYMIYASSLLRQQKTVTRGNTHRVFWEPGINSGYRVEQQPAIYYLKSVFQIHNETLNIWSHAIGFVIVVYNMFWCSNILPVESEDYWYVLMVFGVCCMLYTFLSSTAHTFHTMSTYHHYLFYMLDYAGIGYYILGLSILVYYCSCSNSYYSFLENSFLPISVFMSWIGFIGACFSRLRYFRPYPWQRKILNIAFFGLQMVFIIGICLPRLSEYLAEDGYQYTSIKHHIRSIIFMALFCVTFSSEMPEKLYPGNFDIVGHSHQIFHVLVTFANVEQFTSAVHDVKEYSIKMLLNHRPCIFKITMSLIIYTLSIVLVFLFLPKLTAQKVKKYS